MNSSSLVGVTGAGGFIASRIVEQLLAAGHRVRGTVRRTGPKENSHLTALPGAAERLELVAADLLAPGAFDDVVRGCEVVMHTASPYLLTVKDPARDLVAPAVEGTRNVLASCQRAPGVRRVVLTSSMAAVTDEPDETHVLTEADWNTQSSLTRNPYYFSKTQAERAAWDFVEKEKPGFDLVVINPFMVIGPSLTPALNTSNQMFVDMLGGTYPGIMNLAWGFVDVRDTAAAHIRAAVTPDAAGRYLCAAETMTMRQLVEFLRGSGYATPKLPKLGLDCTAGDYLVKLSSYLQPKGVASYLRTHVGRTPRFDHGKIRRELGLEFRPLAQTLRDTLADLKKWGHLPAA